MNYAIEQVEIGGQLRPIKFGTNQTSVLCKLRGISLKEVNELYAPEKWSSQDIGATDVRDLVYSGLVAGCLSSKTQPDFTEIEVGDWIDEMSLIDLQKIMSIYMESLIPKDLRAKVKELMTAAKEEKEKK
jgi:hypothetical protein